MIYFIQTADNRYVKIGTAEDPIKRLAGIQTSMPYKIRLIGVMLGDYALESTLHHKFRSTRVRGEWFQTTRALVEHAIYEGAPRLYREYIKSTHANTYAELVRVEGALLELHAEASAIYDDGRNHSFCANTVWYRQFKSQLMSLVGWDSQVPDDRFHTSEAYSAAYQTIYNALPDCRGCMCG